MRSVADFHFSGSDSDSGEGERESGRAVSFVFSTVLFVISTAYGRMVGEFKQAGCGYITKKGSKVSVRMKLAQVQLTRFGAAAAIQVFISFLHLLLQLDD